MKYHKYLEKQIKKHLPDTWSEKPEIEAFLEAINDSFHDFEKDKELTNHAFKMSEEEYAEVNENLKKILDTQNQTFMEVKQALSTINPAIKTDQHTDILNITEILNAELAKSKELQYLNEKILATSLNAIICFDLNGKITYWNASAEEVFGYTQKQSAKIPFPKIIAEPCRTHFMDGIEAYLESGDYKVFTGIKQAGGLTQSGAVKNLEMHVFPVENEQNTWFCAFIQDKTESILAQKKLQEQEERYRNMINNINLGLIEVDNNEKVTFLNPSFSNISGYSEEDLMGKKLSNTLQLSKESRKMIQDKKVLRKTGVADQYEIMVKNKNGSVRWWVISGSPRYDDQGNIVGSIGIHLDVTDRKKLETKLIQAKELAERNSNIKESILNTMSHEIRTPLNGIMGMLKELSKQELPTESSKPLEYSIVASDHLMSIVNNILDYSQLEAGKMKLHYQPHNLSHSIEKILQILGVKIREKNLEVSVHKSLKNNHIMDAMKLEQILFNIVGNAIKFTDQGNIEIHCEARPLQAHKELLNIRVKDTGIGMDTDTLENIFTQYSQGNTQTQTGQKGTGLGMAITKELVQLMEGEIQVESQLGKGTSFTVSLPLEIHKGALAIPNNQDLPSLDLRGKSILLVDDEELNLLVLENALKSTSALLDTASNATETLQKIKEKDYDLILLDLFLPDKNGNELAKILKQNPEFSSPIIGMSANVNEKYIESCYEAGMVEYILKPFDEKDLHSKIESVLMKENVQLYDLSQLLSMSRGNQEFIDKMINIFIKNARVAADNIGNAIQTKNLTEVQNILHKIKPSVHTLQIQPVMDTVAFFEQIEEGSNWSDAIESPLTKMQETLYTVANQMEVSSKIQTNIP